MAGGDWNDQNKVLPGIYIRYESDPKAMAVMGERGTAAIAWAADWGPQGETVIINTIADSIKLGYAITHPKMLFLRQILRGTNRTSGANKVRVYVKPTTGSAKATKDFCGSPPVLTVTAQHPGIVGNSLSVSVVADLDTETDTPGTYAIFTVTTYLDGVIVDSQTVGSFTDEFTYTIGTPAMLANNDWVTFSGTGSLVPDAGSMLVGGVNGVVAVTADSDFMNAIELQPFDVIIYDGTNPSMKAAYALFAKNLSNQQGRRCQACVFDYANADHETCISPIQGVTLNTGETLTGGEICWWVGGIASGAKLNESLTYSAHPDAVAVNPALTLDGQEAALRKGQFALFELDGRICVVSDINTFSSFTPTKAKSFAKNRVIRTLFGIANDLFITLSKGYIGSVHNDDNGRALIKSEVVQYLLKLQTQRAIQEFVTGDVTVQAGDDVDAVLVGVYVKPVDSVEKVYMSIVFA